MKPCLLQYLIDRRELLEERSKPTLLPNNKIYMYDLHDGKLLYLLTQHSMWNRRNHPFIFCKCKRNNSFIHDCNMWNDKQYEEKWDLSKRKWEVMAPLPQEWNMNKHKKWSDEKNYGVTHFEIDPQFLPISTIRFDVFHLSCALIRRMMTTLRNFMLKQSVSVST